MSQAEIYGTRCNAYSIWHRTESTKRFVGYENARSLAMIDCDAAMYIEYDDETKDPIALIETIIDTSSSDFKATTITRKLAIKSDILCFLVAYGLSENKNPSYPNANDIEYFKVKLLHPSFWTEFKTYTPKEWAEELVRMREWCKVQCYRRPFRLSLVKS